MTELEIVNSLLFGFMVSNIGFGIQNKRPLLCLEVVWLLSEPPVVFFKTLMAVVLHSFVWRLN